MTHGLYSPWNSPGKNKGVGNLCLFQGIFPTQRLNPGLPHFRWIYSGVKPILFSWDKSLLHFYETSSLLPLINLFLLTPATGTPPLCSQHHSTQLIIKILLMPLTGPDNPLLYHYSFYYLEWIYDNEVFTFGNTSSCTYGRLREKINDSHSLRAIRG